MYRVAPLVLLLWSCAGGPEAPESRRSDPNGISWCRDLEDAHARALTDGHPVAAFLTFDTCHWSKVLERETFPDAAVVAQSRGFHWVEINRDKTPEIADRLNVSAYPSILVLGPKDENLYRFEGFKKPGEFVPELERARQCHDLFTRGADWDTPAPRPPRICDAGTVTTLPAPSVDVPSGVVALGVAVWVAYRKELYRLQASDGSVQARFTLPEPINGLCSDGQLLYGLEFGWSTGRPIHVIDPATGKVLREIVTKANQGEKESSAYGIAWAGGALHVLAGQGEIHRLAADGRIASTLKTPLSYVMGLCYDGSRFVTGGREGLHFVDPKSGKVVRHIDTHYPVRALGWDGKTLLLLEQPVFGFGRHHERITLWPKIGLLHRVEL